VHERRWPGRPRTTRAAVIAVATAATALATIFAPSVSARHREGPCDPHRQEDESEQSHMRELIRCATNHWTVFGGYEKALCIAKRESGLNPRAVSSDGKYLGLYQHAKRYWPGRYDAYTRRAWELNDSALIGRTNAIVSIRMASDVGWGAWRGTGCAVTG
jgi:hypothetical protein